MRLSEVRASNKEVSEGKGHVMLRLLEVRGM